VLLNHLDVEPGGSRRGWRSPPFEARRAAVDLRPRHVRHEEPDHRPAAGDDRLRASGRPRPRGRCSSCHQRARSAAADSACAGSSTSTPSSRRFWAVLTEGGVVEATSPSDIKYWGTEFAQKRFARLVVCAPSGSRSRELGRAVRTAGTPRPSLRSIPRWRASRGYAADRAIAGLPWLLAEPAGGPARPAAFRKLPPVICSSLFRNEAVPFDVEGARRGAAIG
jgi:hypothetical protein